MSSVIAALDDTQVILATDTLCTVYDGSGPSFLCSKAFMVPHMNMLVAAAGASGFLDHWCQYLNRRKRWPGIECLSQQAATELCDLWAEWKIQHPWPAGMEHEQAIFQFGISEFTGEMLGFAHYSWNDFRCEDMSYRAKGHPVIFARPECLIPDIDDMSQFPKACYGMMQEQRAKQASKAYGADHDGRVTIGGEVQIHHLNQLGCAVYKAGRFDDFDRIEKDLWGDFRASWAADRAEGKV